MLFKTHELKDEVLDWAVAKCEGYEGPWIDMPQYSSDWAHAGPILEREKYSVNPNMRNGEYDVYRFGTDPNGKDAILGVANSLIVAVLRCHVYSKFGSQINIPDHFLGDQVTLSDPDDSTESPYRMAVEDVNSTKKIRP